MKRLGLSAAFIAGLLVIASLLSSSTQSADSVAAWQAPVDFKSAAQHTVNGVVSIKSYTTASPRYSRQQGNGYSDPFFEFFFGPGFGGQQRQPQEAPREQQLGLGSGVILTADGYIVTNNHVIDGAERLEVTLNDNRSFDATVIGTDPSTDIALIKIEADGLSVIPVADSESLSVGEWVLAVGNPFGFTSTVTAGIVSAKGRSISALTSGRTMGIEAFIQTDAAVNPGNSGGALVNTSGQLVGINTAIYSQTGNYAGHSFAIPTSIMTKVVDDLKKYGAVQRAVLGIRGGELTAEICKKEDITAVTSGIYVGAVENGTAADEAGLKEGDVIVGINGHTVNTFGELQEQLSKYSPGDRVTVAYVRNNAKATVEVTLRNGQGNTNLTRAGSFDDLGVVLKTPDARILKKLRVKGGVEVDEITAGKFRDAGIREGFIILEINNGRVASAADVEKIYKAIMSADASYDKVMFIIGIYPDGARRYYAVDLTE